MNTFGPPRLVQENFRKVRPRLPRTLLTHTAMAVDSLAYFLLPVAAAFKVDPRRPTLAVTPLMHRQNFRDIEFRPGMFLIDCP